jgi:NAD(P)-dependent dehydrogenase (short-subunit alcohol dehydrogenase family)
MLHIYRRSNYGQLEGKVAVITGGSSGLALASAKRFVEEGAYVFITGRRQEQLDEAVKLIGRNVTGVRGDAANLDDLDRLFDTIKREKGKIALMEAQPTVQEIVNAACSFGQDDDITVLTVTRIADTERSDARLHLVVQIAVAG